MPLYGRLPGDLTESRYHVAMTKTRSLGRLDGKIADTEPWYESGSINLNDQTVWVKATFRNDRAGESVVQALTDGISEGGLLVRHRIPASAFTPDRYNADEAMAAVMRKFMGKDTP
jgi:hypothetical protein